MALVARGVPFELALSLSEAERFGLLVIFGEVDGGVFDWDMLRWEKGD